MGGEDWFLRRGNDYLGDRAHAAELIWRRALSNRGPVIDRQREEIEWLRSLVTALAELCIEKGLVTEDELRDRIRRLDEARSAAAKPPRPAPRRRRRPPAR